MTPRDRDSKNPLQGSSDPSYTPPMEQAGQEQGGTMIAQRMGAIIRARREAWPGGMSVRKLSEVTGISPSAISGYERGEYAPSLDAAVKIARALWLDLNALWSGEAVTDQPGSEEP